MPPKKRLGKELSAEGTSQAAGEKVPTTTQTTIQTTHIPQTLPPQQSTKFHAATTDPMEQPIGQAEVLVMNTSAPNTVPPPLHQHQTIEALEDLQQDSEEEIKAVIEDELVHLCQENECLRLCHTPFRERGNEASIRVPRMFKSHAWQQYD
jgi:hypothetical protein